MRKLVIAFFAFWAVAAAPAAHALNLKLATLSPEGSLWMKTFREAADEIAKETEGRVTLRFYPGGVMGNDAAVLRKIRIGQLHGGAVTTGSLSQIDSDLSVYSLPFAFNNLNEVDAARAVVDTRLMAGLEEKGFVSFGLMEGGFAYMFSKRSITTLADLQQSKVWVPEGDDLALAVMRGVGVTPIPLSIADVLPGLQTGLVDAVLNTPIGALALQWHTGVSTLTDAPLAYITALIAIDKKVFDRIAPEDRAIVRKHLSEASRVLDKQNREDNQAAFKALEGQGVNIIKPDATTWAEIVSRARKAAADSKLYDAATVKALTDAVETYRKDGNAKAE